MENKPKKIYLSNLKPVGSTTGLKGRIYLDKVPEFQSDDKGRQYFNYTIWENQQPDQYGNTHVMVLDTWKPEPKKEASTSDLPF
jgi:hypothetical protein